MRLGVAFERATANAYYRAIYPVAELERRGHTVYWPDRVSYRDALAGVPNWDLLHLHQFVDDDNIAVVRRLRDAGVAVVWDTDDDLQTVPKGSVAYKRLGGRRGLKRLYARSVEIAREVHLVTTTNEHLADVYRGEGVEHVAVIENHLARVPSASASRRRRQGVTIGVVAAHEHGPDFERLRLAPALQAVLDRFEDVAVVAVGVDLGLRDRRYTHVDEVSFTRLGEMLETFDIGLAPLLDTPFNRSRSNVKLKEYAAAGVAWLASPVGPYEAGAGGASGGLFVADDGWEATVSALVADLPRRRELASAGRAWAQRQTIRQAGGRWEAAFRDAAMRARRAATR